MDDIFLVFRSHDHIEPFLNYLNSRHANIEFTSEIEIDCKLPFLDVLISHCNGVFTTSVYRKPTFTGLTTNFYSLVPSKFKINLIATLATRAFRICSNYCLLHTEFDFIRKLLCSNNFNINFIDFHLGKLLEKF